MSSGGSPAGARWHDAGLDEVVARLATDPCRGLSADEAARRLAHDGPNELRKGRVTSPLVLLAAQFRSVIVWILVGAAIVSALLGETIDAVAIVAIVALNAAIGFFQEYRAERAVAALARLTAPRARVVRSGRTTVLLAAEVVRGDLLVFDGGDLVAADARLLEAAQLRTLEAPLTGESEPVEKRATVCAADTPLADRRNMVFLGTSVASGVGRALVVATGMATEVGHIAALLETASSGQTPLERKLDRVGRRLLWACLAIVVVVVALGLARGTPALELFMTAVSLAVAAIPEGLPAVVTVALALGVQRMARRGALVRRLPAVETLGSAEVICTDKTGTLTVGEMTVRKVVTPAHVFGVTGEGYATDGSIFADGAESDTELASIEPLLRAAVACNDAELVERDGQPAVAGDPTEGALLVLAAKGGVGRDAIDVTMPVLARMPFDSDRKRMTVVRRCGAEAFAFVKGAPEVVLERCAHMRGGAGVEPLTENARARMLEASALLANDALRVLALAERRLETFPGAEDPEDDLTFLGLVGMQDPPRVEAREAVERCRLAGIKTVMITGDHPETARAIARELGIFQAEDEMLDGRALDTMSDDDLARRVRETAVYARVTAEHKLRIVRAWKANGVVVAMTGDGVNDAPALKEASVGIAMGIAGTEVTKEAAELVVTDDNFASIVAAVEEGRGIYDNIAKTLGYLLAGNTAELAVMLVAGLVGWPLPLLPAQLLWINLVTDGLPALGLATDPVDRAVLARPPRHPDAELMDRSFVERVAVTGSLIAMVALGAFGYEMIVGASLAEARNAGFAVLVFAQLLRAFGARSDVQTIWEVGMFSNLRLFGIVVVTVALQLTIHQAPALQPYFGTRPISALQGLVWMALAAIPLVVLELRKVLHRRAVELAVAERAARWPRELEARRRSHAGGAVIAIVLCATVAVARAQDRDGAGLYAAYCASCHGAQARGDGIDADLFSPPPPSLRSGVLSKHTDDELIERVRHGRPLAIAPDVLRARGGDVEMLVAYMRRLPGLRWRRLERGQEIYVDRCEVCHGPFGHPSTVVALGVTKPPRDLSDPAYQRATSDAKLLDRVQHGHRAMPAIPGFTVAENRDALIAYLRLLSPGYEHYSRFCAPCHGDDGRGPGVDWATTRRPIVVFDEAYFAKRDPEVLRRDVWHMLADESPQMPHMSRAVRPSEVRAILDYLRALP